VKSFHFIATLLCCLIAVAPHTFAQDRRQDPASDPASDPTWPPADTRPQLEPFDTSFDNINAPGGPDLRNAPANRELKIFTLKNIDAVWARHVISELFGSDLPSLAVDERSNSLMVRGSTQLLPVIETLLLRIDSVSARDADPASIINLHPQVVSDDGNNRADLKLRDVSSSMVDALRDHYNKMNAQCRTIARQFREVEAVKQAQRSKKLTELRRKLGIAVGDAFQARQQLQRAELAAFQQRTQQIRQTIELRDQIAGQIINSRVEQLLNPNAQWDNTPATDPSRIGRSAAPRFLGELPDESISFAERVEADVAQRERIRTQMQGSWVLARTKNDHKPQILAIDTDTLVLVDAVSNIAYRGTFRLDSPRKGNIVVEFGKDWTFSRIWMGSFEITIGERAIKF